MPAKNLSVAGTFGVGIGGTPTWTIAGTTVGGGKESPGKWPTAQQYAAAGGFGDGRSQSGYAASQIPGPLRGFVEGTVKDVSTGEAYFLGSPQANALLAAYYKAHQPAPVSDKPAGTVIGTSTKGGVDYVTISQGVGEKPRTMTALEGLKASQDIKFRNVEVAGAVIGQQEQKISSLQHQKEELLKVYQGQKRDWRAPGATVSMPEVLKKIEAIDKELGPRTDLRNRLVQGYQGKAKVAGWGATSLEAQQQKEAYAALEAGVKEKYAGGIPLSEQFGLEAQQASSGIQFQSTPIKGSAFEKIAKLKGELASLQSEQNLFGKNTIAKQNEIREKLEKFYSPYSMTPERKQYLTEVGGPFAIRNILPEAYGWAGGGIVERYVPGEFQGPSTEFDIPFAGRYKLGFGTKQELKETAQRGGSAFGEIVNLAALGYGIGKLGKVVDSDKYFAKMFAPSKTTISKGEMFISSSANDKTYSLLFKGEATQEFKGLKTLFTGKTRTTPIQFSIAGEKLADFSRPLEQMGFAARVSSAKGGTKWIIEPKTSIQRLVTTKGEAPFGKGMFYSEPGILKPGVAEALPYLKSNVFGGKISFGKGKATEFFQTGTPVETSLNVKTMISPKGTKVRSMGFVDIKGQAGAKVLTEGATGEAYSARLWQNLLGKSMPAKIGAKFGGKGFIGGTIKGETPILLKPIQVEFLQAGTTKASIGGFEKFGSGKLRPLSEVFGKSYLTPEYPLTKRIARAVEVKFVGGPTGYGGVPLSTGLVETTTTKTTPLLSGFKPSEAFVPAVVQATKEISYSIPGSYVALAGGLGRVKTTPTEKLYFGEMKARYGGTRKPQQPFVEQTGIKEFDALTLETSKAEQPFKAFGQAQPLKGFEEFAVVPKQRLGEFLGTGTGTGSKLLTLTGTETKTLEKTKLQTRNLLGTASITGLATKSKLATAQRTQQAETTKLAERIMQSQRTNIMQAQRLGLAQKTRQVTQQATKLLTPFAETPLVKTPRVPFVLFPPITHPSKSVKAFGYQVLVREKGKKVGKKWASGAFVPISSGVMPKEQALALGQAITAGTAKRSFKLAPAFGSMAETKRLPAFRPEMYYRKGRTFIEKAKYSILEVGERKEITQKGLQTLKMFPGLRKKKGGLLGSKRPNRLKPFKIF